MKDKPRETPARPKRNETFAGVVRSKRAWIEEKLFEGWRLEKILQALNNEGGFNASYGYFRDALWKARKHARARAETAPALPAPQPAAPQQGQNSGQQEESEAPPGGASSQDLDGLSPRERHRLEREEYARKYVMDAARHNPILEKILEDERKKAQSNPP